MHFITAALAFFGMTIIGYVSLSLYQTKELYEYEYEADKIGLERRRAVIYLGAGIAMTLASLGLLIYLLL